MGHWWKLAAKKKQAERPRPRAIGSALNIAQEDRERQFDDRLSAAERELEQAQREFASARARAAQLRGDESGTLAEEVPAELQKAASRIADGISEAASLTGKATARGTFNPAALLGLQGGGSVEEKQLRELELLNKTSKETKAEIRKAKPVFTCCMIVELRPACFVSRYRSAGDSRIDQLGQISCFLGHPVNSPFPLMCALTGTGIAG